MKFVSWSYRYAEQILNSKLGRDGEITGVTVGDTEVVVPDGSER
jgi:hypothetical protein